MNDKFERTKRLAKVQYKSAMAKAEGYMLLAAAATPEEHKTIAAALEIGRRRGSAERLADMIKFYQRKAAEQPRIYIYAGERQQAEWLARALGYAPHAWGYVSDRRSIEGLPSCTTVLRYGTYRRRPDHEELCDAMLAYGFSILDVNDDFVRDARQWGKCGR